MRNGSKLFARQTLIVTALLLSTIPSFSQEPDSTHVLESDSASAGIDGAAADTTLFVPELDRAGAKDVGSPVDLEHHLTQNPTAALFKSMFVPGWGQIGNRKYIKAGVVIGLQFWFVSSAVKHGRDASDLRSLWEAETDPDRRRLLYDRFDDKRGQRDKFIWFAGLTTFLSMFDAYVDAHLSGSPTDKRNDRFSLDVGPDPGGGAKIQAVMKF